MPIGLASLRQAPEGAHDFAFLEDLDGYGGVVQGALPHRAKRAVAEVPLQLDVLCVDDVQVLVIERSAAADGVLYGYSPSFCFLLLPLSNSNQPRQRQKFEESSKKARRKQGKQTTQKLNKSHRNKLKD